MPLCVLIAYQNLVNEAKDFYCSKGLPVVLLTCKLCPAAIAIVSEYLEKRGRTCSAERILFFRRRGRFKSSLRMRRHGIGFFFLKQ